MAQSECEAIDHEAMLSFKPIEWSYLFTVSDPALQCRCTTACGPQVHTMVSESMEGYLCYGSSVCVCSVFALYMP